jgi:hypothetical protein
MTATTIRYIRLRDLQIILWARKHHRTAARKVGVALRQMREDHAYLRNI